MFWDNSNNSYSPRGYRLVRTLTVRRSMKRCSSWPKGKFRSDRSIKRWTVWKTKDTSLRSRAVRRNGADRPDAIPGCALPASGHYGRRLKLRGGCNKPPDSYGNLRHESDSITEGSPASMDRSNCEVADATLCCGSIGRLEGLQPSRSATGLEGGRYHFGLQPDLDTTCL